MIGVGTWQDREENNKQKALAKVFRTMNKMIGCIRQTNAHFWRKNFYYIHSVILLKSTVCAMQFLYRQLAIFLFRDCSCIAYRYTAEVVTNKEHE